MKTERHKVVWAGGIYEQEMIATDHPGIYKLASAAKDEYAILHIAFDGHLWPASHHMEQTLRLQPQLNRSFVEDNWAVTCQYWDRQYQINLGIAEYLGKKEEGLALKARLTALRQEQADQRATARAMTAAGKEAAITQAQADLRAGASISAEHFLILCKRHGVQIPLRTHGWIKRRLRTISQTTYTSCGSRSERVFDVLAKLLAAMGA